MRILTLDHGTKRIGVAVPLTDAGSTVKACDAKVYP